MTPYLITAALTAAALLAVGWLVLLGLGRSWTRDDAWFLASRSLFWGALWPVTWLGVARSVMR